MAKEKKMCVEALMPLSPTVVHCQHAVKPHFKKGSDFLGSNDLAQLPTQITNISAFKDLENKIEVVKIRILGCTFEGKLKTENISIDSNFLPIQDITQQLKAAAFPTIILYILGQFMRVRKSSNLEKEGGDVLKNYESFIERFGFTTMQNFLYLFSFFIFI